MRKHPLLIAVPAFLLGVGLTASVTTARAQFQTNSPTVDAGPLAPARAVASAPMALAAYEYKVVDSEAGLNLFGAQGYEYVGQSSLASSTAPAQTLYTMRRRK